jgi:hypothetical protein
MLVIHQFPFRMKLLIKVNLPLCRPNPSRGTYVQMKLLYRTKLASPLCDQPRAGSERRRSETMEQGRDNVVLDRVSHTSGGGDRWVLSNGGMIIRRKIENTCRKTRSSAISPISYEATRDWTRGSEFRSQLLTVWVVIRPARYAAHVCMSQTKKKTEKLCCLYTPT